MSKNPQTVVPAIVQVLEADTNNDPIVRCSAILALEKYGTNSDGTVPALLKCLRDPSLWVRENASQALERLAVAVPTAER
jgi:HEAT repeat protein